MNPLQHGVSLDGKGVLWVQSEVEVSRSESESVGARGRDIEILKGRVEQFKPETTEVLDDLVVDDLRTQRDLY